jgi:hypothetical protein
MAGKKKDRKAKGSDSSSEGHDDKRVRRETPSSAAGAPPTTSDIMAYLTDQFEKLNYRFNKNEQAVAALEKTIEDQGARIAKLEASQASSAGPPRTYAAAAMGSGSGASPSPAPAATRPAGGPAVHAETPINSPSMKVIALGFPRRLPRQALLAHWEAVAVGMPQDIKQGTTPNAGNAKAYSITFADTQSINKFMNYMRDNPDKAEWTDPRDGATRINIAFKRERPLADRDRGKALSPAWEFTQQRVTQSTKYAPEMRIVTDTRRGTISAATSRDMWELFRLDATADGYALHADNSNLEHFGIAEAEFEHLLRGAGR